MSQRVFTIADEKENSQTDLEAHAKGVKEAPVLGPENVQETITAGNFNEHVDFIFANSFLRRVQDTAAFTH